jgi:hypothetical protein
MYQPGVMWAWLYRRLRSAAGASMRFTMQVTAAVCHLIYQQMALTRVCAEPFPRMYRSRPQVFQVTAEHVAWACRLVLRQLRRARDALVLVVRRIASSVLNAVLVRVTSLVVLSLSLFPCVVLIDCHRFVSRFVFDFRNCGWSSKRRWAATTASWCA